MKGFIIDGVSTSGKSSILSHIQKKLNEDFPNMSKLFFSEHYTQRMLEHLRDEGSLSGTDVSNHFDSIIQTLSVYKNMLDNSKFSERKGNADMLIILERSVFTHILSYPSLAKEYEEESITDHLNKFKELGIKHVILKLSEEHMDRRLKSSLLYRNEYWKNYLDSLGTREDIVSYFINWQKSLLDLVDKYKESIDIVVIEINSDNYQEIAEIIYSKIFK